MTQYAVWPKGAYERAQVSSDDSMAAKWVGPYDTLGEAVEAAKKMYEATARQKRLGYGGKQELRLHVRTWPWHEIVRDVDDPTKEAA